MRANKGKNRIYFDQISSFERKRIEKFRIEIIRLLNDHIQFRSKYLNYELELFIFTDFKILELNKMKRQTFEDQYFCEITYRQKIFDLDKNLIPVITDNENNFLHFLHRNNFFLYPEDCEQIALGTIDMILIYRLITLNMQPTPIKTLLIDEIYNERGQKCFYYLSQNFPDSEKYTGIIKYSIIYRLLDKNKYTKKTTTQEKYFELIRKQFKDELNGKSFRRIEFINTGKNNRIKDKTEKLLNDFDKEL